MKYRLRLRTGLIILLLPISTAVFPQTTAAEWKASIPTVTYIATVKVRHPSANYPSDERAPANKTFAVVEVELTPPNPEAKLRLEDITLVDEASA